MLTGSRAVREATGKGTYAFSAIGRIDFGNWKLCDRTMMPGGDAVDVVGAVFVLMVRRRCTSEMREKTRDSDFRGRTATHLTISRSARQHALLLRILRRGKRHRSPGTSCMRAQLLQRIFAGALAAVTGMG